LAKRAKTALQSYSIPPVEDTWFKFAELCQFYKWSLQDIRNMTKSEVDTFYSNMIRLKSEDVIVSRIKNLEQTINKLSERE
jgi:ppGpp synthetase/RelA/SpoT-type nucleotidyltranferase